MFLENVIDSSVCAIKAVVAAIKPLDKILVGGMNNPGMICRLRGFLLEMCDVRHIGWVRGRVWVWLVAMIRIEITENWIS